MTFLASKIYPVYIVLIPCRDLGAMKHTYASNSRGKHPMEWPRKILLASNRGYACSIPARGNIFFSYEVCVESQLPAQLCWLRKYILCISEDNM